MWICVHLTEVPIESENNFLFLPQLSHLILHVKFNLVNHPASSG